MKTIKILTAAIIMLTTFNSCADKKEEGKSDEKSKETEDSKSSALEGAWEIKRATGDLAEMNVGIVYTFAGDKLSLSYNNGTTEVTEKTFSFKAEGTEHVFLYDYKMEGDTLVVSLQNSGQTFYMTKK